eukprot:CAMPEP_0174740868 /NCGR_PEP_ID=MMETSP1094-20130205/74693_1 /TAXON_ID=156173 /ORGANISM="Chrysochromulina brevifilum, Strain UTEX LB 985" /LENGTH=102 /DNA_ID=CAMNT_0015944651 /DNA_START=195 /DNA_END=504 /DNA_ORIENTATION=+
MAVCNGPLATPAFAASMRKCFVECCLAPGWSMKMSLIFKIFTEQRQGKLSKHLLKNLNWPVEAALTDVIIGEIASETLVTTRSQDDEDEDDEGENEGEDELE